MLKNMCVMMDSIIPISRFNDGEANKIFEEVKQTGCRIVIENNSPSVFWLLL